ncbi:unnamed protein product, partial [Candidula unifasciata]
KKTKTSSIMSSKLVILAMLASFIQILRADCVIEGATPISVTENASVCVPIDPSKGETEQQFGNKFQICLNSTFQVFECNEGMKYDVVSADCRQGPHRCQGDDGNSTLTSSTQATESNATSPPPASAAAAATTTSTSTSTSSVKATTTKKANVTSKPGNMNEPSPVVVPLGTCTSDKCKPPHCSCLNAKPNIDLSKAPMMVMLTFDDAVTAAYMDAFYRDLLVDNRHSLRNPNNCSIKATFFLSAANTDYKQVRILYDNGNEFASHTVNHILPDGGTKEEYKEEIVGIRELLVSEVMADETKVVGYRAPFLKLAGNQMFQVLHGNNFRYDSSISNIERKKGKSHLWPFTLDFPIPQENCPNGPCPTESFPGLWEVPLNAYTTDEGHCAMIDACIVANTTDDKEVVREKYRQFFKQNFKAFYSEKVPMHIFTHSSLFLRHQGSFEALVDCMKEINDLPEVWFLTPSQVLDWMKTPVSNDDAIKGAIPSWTCQDSVH